MHFLINILCLLYEAMLLKDRVAEDFVNQTGKGFADCIREGIRELGWENRKYIL